MANEKNLTHKLTASELRKGGRKSGQARREKKTVQKILGEMLDMSATEYPQFANIARKVGLQGDKSVKEVFTAICLFNSVKNGNLAELERIVKLLGEESTKEANNGILDELTEYMKNVK